MPRMVRGRWTRAVGPLLVGLGLTIALLWLASPHAAVVAQAQTWISVNYAEDSVWGVYPAGHTFWITLTNGSGSVKATAVVSTTITGKLDGFQTSKSDWSPGQPDIQSDDWLHAQSDDGYRNAIHVGRITGNVDVNRDSIAGHVFAAWFTQTLSVQCEPRVKDQRLPVKQSTAAPDGSVGYVCHWDPSTEWDIQYDQGIAVWYFEPDGDSVVDVFRAAPQFFSVNYAHDWMGGNYPAGHTFWVTVTNASGAVKATARCSTAPGKGGDGFQTVKEDWSPALPDIQPDDWVLARADDGYTNTIHVGTITGTLDARNDSVTGRIYATWFTQPLLVLGQVWACCNAPEKRTTAPPDGSASYLLQWNPATEFDIQPGQDVAVMYVEPDGDRVINVFREPSPNLRVEKWAEGNATAAPGFPAVYSIRYRNEGDGPTASVLLTDTLPAFTTYVADSSGVAASVEPGSVRWTLGPLAAGEERSFQLVLGTAPSATATLRNQVDGYVANDPDPGNNHAEADVMVSYEQPDLWINLNPGGAEPAPGQTYLYEIGYGNSGLERLTKASFDV